MTKLQKFLQLNAPTAQLLQMVASFIMLSDGRIFITDFPEKCNLALGPGRIPVRKLDKEERIIVGTVLSNGYAWVESGGHYRIAPASFQAMALQQMFDAGVQATAEVC